ncbi:MAG TPA: VWA domain-containing protein [Thermoanaerobaculia bacterium]|nr:VWA domain-containing protein [Thermoanaerobaculia bacterium]
MMNERMMALVVASILFLAPAAPHAQTPEVAESVDVTLVEIPVTVVDRNGKPVRGLTAENFQVLDEGKRQPITHFEVVDVARVSAGDEDVPAAARRNFVILFDLANATPSSFLRARDAAREFVRTQLRLLDSAAVASFRVESGIQLHTSFTSDENLLAAAIATLGNPRLYQIHDPLLLSASMRGEAPGSTTTEVDAASIATEELAELNRLHQQGNDDYHRGRIRSQLRTFGGFARLLDSVRGRKHVILLSEGFDPSLVRGRGLGETMADRGDAEASISGQIWSIDSDQRFGSTEASREVDAMAQAFKRSDVVLHAVDIRGLRSDVDAREGYRRASSDGLFLISRPTGGELFRNANDLGASLANLLRQQDLIYVIGFQPRSSGSPGKYHDLDVRVSGVSGARVIHRDGYYEPAEELSPLERTLITADLLVHAPDRSELTLMSFAAPFLMEGERAVVPVIVEIPGGPLMAGAGPSVTVDLFVYAFDESNTVRDFLHQKVALDLTKVAPQLRESGLKFFGSLRLEPGDYSVRTLVQAEETGRRGYHVSEVTVPVAGTSLVLPPLVWEEEGRWIMVKARPRSASEVDYPFQLANQSFIPAARPQLVAGEPVEVAVFTYGIEAKGMGLTAVVEDAEGATRPAQVSLTGMAPPDASGATKLLLRFTPAALAPGEYELRISVAQKEPASTTSSSVRFEIVGKPPAS